MLSGWKMTKDGKFVTKVYVVTVRGYVVASLKEIVRLFDDASKQTIVTMHQLSSEWQTSRIRQYTKDEQIFFWSADIESPQQSPSKDIIYIRNLNIDTNPKMTRELTASVI